MDNSSYWDLNDVTREATFDEFGEHNGSAQEEDPVLKAVTNVVVPVIFSFISVLGFVGNLSVIVVVASNMQMRSTTNTLIISLAMADLLFIVTCVPFTAVAYNSVWPFGTVWCKIYHFSIHVTAYVSVYTLVLMSLDRYLAVVHPIRSMTLRTPRNAAIAVLSATTVICLGNSFMFTAHDVIEYSDGSANLTLCVNVRIANDDSHYGCLFYGSFFALAFAVPLSLVCLLYGLMLRRLRRRKGPASSSSSASTTTSRDTRSPAACKRRQLINSNEPNHKAVDGGSNKLATTTQAAGRAASKRRVTRLVVVVVVTFAVYWLPFQVTLVTQFCAPDSVFDTSTLVFIKIAANCLAYMNSCVNPILYAFLSEPFRKSFRRLLVCRLWGQSSGGMRSPDQRGRRAASQKAASKRYQTGQKAAAPLNNVVGGQTPSAVATTTANGRLSTAVVNGRNDVDSASPDGKERIVQLVDCYPTTEEQQQQTANGQAQLVSAAAAAATETAAAAEVDLLCEAETNL